MNIRGVMSQKLGTQSKPILNRRSILNSLFAGSALGLFQAGHPSYGAQKTASRFRIWDIHSHLGSVPGETPEERMEVVIRCADRFGIERLVLSQGFSTSLHPTEDLLREENDRVMRAVRRFPDRAYGSVYLSPSFPDFSLREFDRCVRDGPMVAIGELEIDKRCNVPEMDAIVERAVSLKAPILQHTWLKLDGNEPGESTPADLVELAKRHPEANFICAHTGGDWERGIRMIRDSPNISAEVAGFDPTAGVVEMAVRELGPERVVYGSDVGGRSFASQLAKVLGADIQDSAKELVLGGNLRRLFTPILRAKGYKA
jgi:predicted TIM-barrel fold metal-dependent hydrolase